MKTAKQLQVGDEIIDQDGIEWTVTKIERIPAAPFKLEITFHNPTLIVHTTTGRFLPHAPFETPAPKEGQLSDGEQQWLAHMLRFGSDGYPIAKMGGKWWVNDAFGVGGCPSPFRTKREAAAFCDRYHQLLQDKKAGRG